MMGPTTMSIPGSEWCGEEWNGTKGCEGCEKGKHVQDVGDVPEFRFWRVEVLMVDAAHGIVRALRNEGKKMDHHHHHLTIVTPGHERGGGGVSRRGRSRMTAKKVVGGHCKKDLLVPAMAYEKHGTGGVEAEHGMLSFERAIRLLEIDPKAKVKIGRSVGEERREADTIGDGKMVIYHRFVRVHVYLTIAEGDLILIVDEDLMSGGEKVHRVRVVLLVEGLEFGELQTP